MANGPLIVEALREIGWLSSLRGQDRFRSRAYQKAAEALARYEGDVDALIDAGRVTDLQGMGAGTARIIAELHQTGRCRLLSDLRKSFPREVARLARLPGLGLARLQTLHAALGIETVEDLERALREGEVGALRGFGPKTVKGLLEGIARLEEAPLRVLLPQAEALAQRLIEVWSAHLASRGAPVGPSARLESPGYPAASTSERPLGSSSSGSAALGSRPARLSVTGALRRRVPAVDRLEVLMISDIAFADSVPSLALPLAGPFVRLQDEPPVAGLFGFEARLQEGLPVRLWVADPGTAGAALLFTTGPERFAEAVLPRASALDDEDRLFKSAGLEPVPPELRTLHRLGDPVPKLVKRDDLLGVVHAHTTDSDGRDDLRAMARGAKALGYRYITITDHSPSAGYANGLEVERLLRQGELIREVEAEEGIRIFRGTESDILREGGLDHPIEVLRSLDVVIASIHGRFRLDPEAMTERLLQTFELPVRVIWGHPLGRLILSRPPIEADLPRILDKMAERGHILEVNGDPHRMDLPAEWVREAKARGIPFVLSADAHSVRGLEMTSTALDVARAGGLEAPEVLNTLPPEAFLRAVHPAGGIGAPS